METNKPAKETTKPTPETGTERCTTSDALFCLDDAIVHIRGLLSALYIIGESFERSEDDEDGAVCLLVDAAREWVEALQEAHEVLRKDVGALQEKVEALQARKSGETKH